MRKVLILAYYFPPSIDAGAKRALAFQTHLPEFGYEPITLTPNDGQYIKDPEIGGEEAPGKILRVGKGEGRDLRSQARASWLARAMPRTWRLLARLHHEIADIPDGYRSFYRPAREAAIELLANGRVDLILAMCSPYTNLWLASSLSRAVDTPFVADLRDLWTQNHGGYRYSKVRWAIDLALERRWLNRAKAVTVATRGLAKKISNRLPAHVTVDVIRNGYLEGDQPTTATLDPTNFRIVFAGTLYSLIGHSVKPLFAALAAIRDRNPRAFGLVRCDFYGTVNPDFEQCRARYGMASAVHHGHVSRKAAIVRQSEADLNVILIPERPELEVAVPTKLYDLFANGRPILLIGPKGGEAAELMSDMSMGAAFREGEVDEISRFIETLVLTKKQNGHAGISPASSSEHNYRERVRGLAAVFDRVLAP